MNVMSPNFEVSVFGLWVFFLYSLYMFFGPNQLFDLTTLIVLLAYFAFFLLALSIFKDYRLRAWVFVFMFVFFVYVCPRLLQYLVEPQSVKMAFGFGVGDEIRITASQVSFAMAYQLLGFLLMLLGAAIGFKFLQKEHKDAAGCAQFSQLTFPSVVLGLLFITLLSDDQVHKWLHYFLGLDHFLTFKELHGILGVLINVDMTFLVAMVVLYPKTKGLKDNLMPFCVVIFLYMIIKVLSGSRGGPIFAILYLIIVGSINANVYEANLKKFWLISVFIAVSGFVTFSVATKIRNVDMGLIENPASDVVYMGNSYSSPLNDPLDKKNHESLDRLGAYFDSLVIITNFPGREDLKGHYLESPYFIKSALNIIVPGVVFECCVVNTTFLPPFMYGKRDLSLLDLPGYYESSIWTASGFMYSLLGFFGGLLALTLAGFLLSLLMLSAEGLKINALLAPFFLLFGLYMFIIMQGMDAYLVDLQKFCLAMFVGYLTIISIDCVTKFLSRSLLRANELYANWI